MGKDVLREFLRDKEFSTSEFIAASLANMVVLYIVNSIMGWNLSFIDPSFATLIPLINLVVAAGLAVNLVFIFFRKQWLWSFTQIILNTLGYLMVSSLYSVFPFTFRNIYIFYSVRFALLIAMIVMAVAVFLHGLKFVLKFIVKYG
ncbi:MULTISPECIES: hypothetical protein [Methanothermobacter]|uniref:Uncharacterized protein n=1 Tax=Methanothermobacter wolfeii TaxID=145261 RepID=A0A9E7RTT7_METWO|nr:hypothetical protein [Methanothermobacter wolfeii]UXH31227.1 hypothetical protein N5910_06700 [Methanothermobacter wolfeii]